MIQMHSANRCNKDSGVMPGNIGYMEIMRSSLLDRPDWLPGRNMLLISLISYHVRTLSIERFGGVCCFYRLHRFQANVPRLSPCLESVTGCFSKTGYKTGYQAWAVTG